MRAHPEALIDPRSLAFRRKAELLGHALARPPARRFLWSLYLAGEAYEELHPEAVWVDRLEPRLGRLLARHLADETRHATVFRALLDAERATPVALAPHEDLGYHLLTHVVPDVVDAALRRGPFPAPVVVRYMAFLHVLELRSLSDLGALMVAAERRGETSLCRALASIVRDERFHASYTHRAVLERAPSPAAGLSVLDRVRCDERRHYAPALGRILARFAALGAPPPTAAGRLLGCLERGLLAVGIGVGSVPRLTRLPARMWPEEALQPATRTQSATRRTS